MRNSKKGVVYVITACVCLQAFFLLFFLNSVSKMKLLGVFYAKENCITNESVRFFQSNPNDHPEVGVAHCSSCYLNGANSNGFRRPEFYEYFTNKYTLGNSNLTSSLIDKNNTQTFCHGNAVIFNNLFGLLHDVTLHPTRRSNMAAQSKGGEEIRDVLGQTLQKEEYSFNADFFVIECPEKMTKFKPNAKMAWMKYLEFVVTKNRNNINYRNDSSKYTIVVRRQDYANLHNWVRNIYNTFLIMMHFNLQPVNVSIMFMDGHPATELDKAWAVIYGQPQRVGRLEQPVKYHNLILGFEENEGPVSNYNNMAVPFLEEFRSFVLSRFDLKSKVQLNCTQLKITIIYRRNAVYHPRNINGNVGRKIFNEAEVTNAIMKTYPGACVKALLMESLPMRAQLDAIRQTDILIGMHGAGMSHTLFLPKHAGLLELFSKNFKIQRPWFRCFQSIASWRQLSYETWENFDGSLEMPNDFTVVPVDIVLRKTKNLVNHLCPNV